MSEPHTRTLELPLLVRSVVFFFFYLSQRREGGLNATFFGGDSPSFYRYSRRWEFGRLSAGFNLLSSYCVARKRIECSLPKIRRFFLWVISEGGGVEQAQVNPN